MDQFTKFGPIQAITRFWGTLSNTQRFVAAVFMAASLALLLVVSVGRHQAEDGGPASPASSRTTPARSSPNCRRGASLTSLRTAGRSSRSRRRTCTRCVC